MMRSKLDKKKHINKFMPPVEVHADGSDFCNGHNRESSLGFLFLNFYPSNTYRMPRPYNFSFIHIRISWLRKVDSLMSTGVSCWLEGSEAMCAIPGILNVRSDEGKLSR